jgi:hypothetical protein
MITDALLERVGARLDGVDGVRRAIAVRVADTEIEPFVVGGDDQAIRDALRDCMPLGFTTRGEIDGTSADSEGTMHVFRFSRLEVP